MVGYGRDRVAMAKERIRASWPALVTLVVSCAYVLWRLSASGWDPVALAELGSRYAEGDPSGTEGYDGQFTYYLAVDPNPSAVVKRLDVPAYRYQRILYPILARVIALGDRSIIPWALLAINLVAHVMGTWAVMQFLVDHDLWRGYALIYGLWVGLVVGVGLDLSGPMAYALVVTGWLLYHRGRYLPGASLIGLALFTKETSLLFWFPLLLSNVLNQRKWRAMSWLWVGGILFAGWQFWLWKEFGSPGLGSGGTMATPFEWIPFMGLWRIGPISMATLGLYILMFGPTIVLPSVWGVFRSIGALRRGEKHAETWALLINSLFIVFMPFSTFREPLSILRVAAGLVVAVILYAAKRGDKRILNYGMFWVPLLVVLLKG
ncbi:MAG: hypothetical protein AMJ88_00910 [Anaerolineae bacterium SM23_ 63]|nr:MAG: hypothetical protein AMJ88_00910 [Anaerolineae bacterium SM23_ 63]